MFYHCPKAITFFNIYMPGQCDIIMWNNYYHIAFSRWAFITMSGHCNKFGVKMRTSSYEKAMTFYGKEFCEFEVSD